MLLLSFKDFILGSGTRIKEQVFDVRAGVMCMRFVLYIVCTFYSHRNIRVCELYVICRSNCA